MMIPMLGFAQGNGGITNENSSTKIEWLNQVGNQYVVRVTNKQSCPANMRVQWGGSAQFRQKLISSNSSDTFWINPNSNPQCFLGAKPVERCTSVADMGTVELNVCQVLPLKFTVFYVTRLDTYRVKVVFVVEDDTDIKEYRIKVSNDGRNFNTIRLLFPDGLTGSKQYSAIINFK